MSLTGSNLHDHYDPNKEPKTNPGDKSLFESLFQESLVVLIIQRKLIWVEQPELSRLLALNK